MWAEEDADPTGGPRARDEVSVTVAPNNSALLSIYPESELWERDGEPVIYKNLPGGQQVQFGYQIITDSANRSITWSVDRADLAEINGAGVLTPKHNGQLVVTAASNAYPEVMASYNVEIRTVATDIECVLTKEKNQYLLIAQKYPADASPEKLYICMLPNQYLEIPEQGYSLTEYQYNNRAMLSTYTDSPTIEDCQKDVFLRNAETEGRYELHSMHDEAPYTVYVTDLDNENNFFLRIYDTQEKRYLEEGEQTGIYWGSSFMIQDDSVLDA